ncbi:MAG: hypothetical protein M3R13_11995 [Armatimonadota bacterium]|nr:hypothetical protein [Armatimonadota bacterium]
MSRIGDRGTFNDGRNQAKRERRSMRFGRAPLPTPTMPKPVRGAFRARLPYRRGGGLLLNMPRMMLASVFLKTAKHP